MTHFDSGAGDINATGFREELYRLLRLNNDRLRHVCPECGKTLREPHATMHQKCFSTFKRKVTFDLLDTLILAPKALTLGSEQLITIHDLEATGRLQMLDKIASISFELIKDQITFLSADFKPSIKYSEDFCTMQARIGIVLYCFPICRLCRGLNVIHPQKYSVVMESDVLPAFDYPVDRLVYEYTAAKIYAHSTCLSNFLTEEHPECLEHETVM